MPHVSACLEAQLLLVGGKHQSALLGLRLRVLLAVLLVACLCLLRSRSMSRSSSARRAASPTCCALTASYALRQA